VTESDNGVSQVKPYVCSNEGRWEEDE